MFSNSSYQFYTSVHAKKKADITLAEYNANLSNTSEPPLRLDSSYYYCHYMYYKNPSLQDIDFSSFHLGLERNPPQNKLMKQQTASVVLYFILGGDGEFNGEHFEAGSFFYIKPFQRYSITGDWFAAWIVIDGNEAKKLVSFLELKEIEQMSSFYDIEGVEQLSAFYLYDFLNLHNSPRYFKAIPWQLLSFLDKDMPVLEQAPAPFNSQIRSTIYNSVKYIDENITTVTVATLAKKASYETKYFSLLFNTVIGTHPKQYIISKKMEIATHYLRNTDYSIEKIMELIGYSHRNGFASIFKKIFGISPQKYREKYKK